MVKTQTYLYIKNVVLPEIGRERCSKYQTGKSKKLLQKVIFNFPLTMRSNR
jgi:hypothetical protein